MLPALCIVGLYGACMAGSVWLRGRAAETTGKSQEAGARALLTTTLLVAAMAAPSTLQFFLPALLPALQCDYAEILRGEWWRIVTALFVQDGGASGAVFNLLSMLLIGAIAERLWGGRQMLIVFFAGPSSAS